MEMGERGCMTVDELVDALASQMGQAVVIGHCGGPLRVNAGLGTGKTYMLILRSAAT